MRTIIFILFLLPAQLLAQKNDVVIPQPLKIRFMEDFTSAKNIRWHSTDNKTYSVNFYHQSHFKKAIYMLGDTIPTVETILTSLNQLPVQVSRSVKSRYKKYLVEKIIQLERGDNHQFQLYLRRDEKQLEIVFGKSGKEISKVKIPTETYLTRR